MESNKLKVIAKVHTDFPTKFGIPRQSGLYEGLAKIVFEKQYRVDEALRGIEQFSHLWLIWGFSLSEREQWSPTVRPPRLGGNKRVGVFATRSPFRPNPLGLSSVELVDIIKGSDGTELIIKGADMVDGTVIYDIKPYLAFTDSHPEARGGFADERLGDKLKVVASEQQLSELSPTQRSTLLSCLEQDPRPHYIEDSQRIYGFLFANFEIKFKVCDNVLYVVEICKSDSEKRQ